MTRLLVSVRSVEEFHVAAKAGVDVIDVKEPDQGSLGRPSRSVVHEIVRYSSAEQQISVALGELSDCLADDYPLPPRIDYAKLGLAHCVEIPDWRCRWATLLSRLPQDITRVAVAYGDWQRARAPRVEMVLATALEMKCQVLLVDTYDKSRGNLLAHLSLADIAVLIERCHRAGLQVALAGSLDFAAIRRLRPLEPDLIAVRSAACRGSRTTNIDAGAIAKLTSLFPLPRVSST